jgi:hypothetical protein
MELSERLDLLLGMKERANGSYYRAYDYDTAISIVNSQSESEIAAPFAMQQSHLEFSRLLYDMNRDIERGNNINLTNLLTRLGNIFPIEHEPADANLHQALIAATAHVTQRDAPRRTEPKDQPVEADSYKPGKNKRKYNSEQGETEIWERVLRAINDLQSEVGGIRRLLAEHGITHEDLPRKSNQQGAAGKENVRDPKSKNQKQGGFTGTAVKGKGKNNNSRPAPPYLPVRQELQ